MKTGIAPTPQLQYAPPVPWQRRPVFRRIFAGLAVLLGVAVGVAIYPFAERRAKAWHWYNRCAKHSASTSTPVLETDSARIKQLRKDPRYGVDASGWLCVVPQEWTALYSELSPPGLKTYGTAFLGELRTPQGKPRLVAVDVTFDTWTHSGDSLVLAWRVITPAAPFRIPRV